MDRLKNLDIVNYVAKSVRGVIRDYRNGQEAISDICTKLLTGKLFRGFDERTSGPMDLRFKASVGNACRNLAEKIRNRRRLLPTIPIQSAPEPGDAADPGDHNDKIIDDFRELLRTRLGPLAVSIFDLRMAGAETKSIVGSPSVGSPGRYTVKQTVQEIKRLAGEYAASLGDDEFLRRIKKATSDEAATVKKRLATARQGR